MQNGESNMALKNIKNCLFVVLKVKPGGFLRGFKDR